MGRSYEDRFPGWYAELEKRHLEHLKFSEIRRALQALSTLYVQNRDKITSGSALDGAGKRAAFALFYGPLHFLAVRHVLEQLRPFRPFPGRIIDLGCGSGSAGAAWALATGRKSSIQGFDLNPWAVKEASWTYEQFGLKHQTSRRDAAKVQMPGRRDALLAAWSINEMRDNIRTGILPRLLESANNGAEILIVEPVARSATPWWTEWAGKFTAIGGRVDEWVFQPDMPASLRLMDKAARLNHNRYKVRSMSVNIGA
jgi:hypothetical protein